MKRIIFIVTYVILIITILYLIFISFENNFIIDKYKNKEYLEKNAKLLTSITLNKSYVSNYNYGNILFQEGEYENAIIEYKKAMKTVMQKDKEYKIRINCALAICKNVNVDETNQESIEKAIQEYEDAVEILKENSCSEYSKDAKRLQKDIEKEIERLKKLQNNQEKKDEKDEKDEKEQYENDETIEDKIKDIKEEATKGQRETERTYKSYNKSYKDRGKNW